MQGKQHFWLMKKAAAERGCLFFDLFNSIPSPHRNPDRLFCNSPYLK